MYITVAASTACMELRTVDVSVPELEVKLSHADAFRLRLVLESRSRIWLARPLVSGLLRMGAVCRESLFLNTPASRRF